MCKIISTNACSCIDKMMIIGHVKEYEIGDNVSNYAPCEPIEGQLCLVSDSIVDNGGYNEEGMYETNYEVTKTLYPIDYCPICGKEIKYSKNDPMQLKLNI